MSSKKDEQYQPAQEDTYEAPEILSFRQDELLPEAKASTCHTKSPTCITVDCTPRF